MCSNARHLRWGAGLGGVGHSPVAVEGDEAHVENASCAESHVWLDVEHAESVALQHPVACAETHDWDKLWYVWEIHAQIA